MTRWSSKALLGAAVALVAGSACAQAGISGETVRIGVLTAMTGQYSDLGGQGSITAAQMAVEDFRAEAKPGFKIELVHADHQNRVDIGANKVRDWIDRGGVDMVTDALNSAVAIAVSKVAAEGKRVVINTGAPRRG